MSQFKIKYKLIIISLSQTILAIIALAAIVTYFTKNEFKKNAVKEIQTLAEIKGNYCEPSLIFDQFEETNNNLSPFSRNTDVDWAIVTTPEGDIIGSY